MPHDPRGGVASSALRALLVDIDGTLIDSNDAHTRSWIAVLKRHGHEFPFDRVRPFIGKGGDKLLGELLGIDGKSPEAEALAQERTQHFSEHELHGLLPTRGARDLLMAVKAAGVKVIVATSAKADETSTLLKQAGLDDLVDDVASSTDAEQSKPDPDIVQGALRKAGVRMHDAVMLGDTPYDVDAARKAGVRTIALRCGGWWNDDAFAAAVAIYDDPQELLGSLADSPLGIGARG